VKRAIVAVLGGAAIAATTFAGTAQAAPATPGPAAAAGCGITDHSKSLGETGFGLRSSVTTGAGCSVKGQLQRVSGSSWKNVSAKTIKADSSGSALFNFDCGARAKYRLKVTTSSDTATITTPGAVC